MQSAKEWMTWGAANVKTHPARASHAMRGPSMPRNAPCPPHKELPLAHSVRFLTQYHRITIRSTPIYEVASCHSNQSYKALGYGRCISIQHLCQSVPTNSTPLCTVSSRTPQFHSTCISLAWLEPGAQEMP